MSLHEPVKRGSKKAILMSESHTCERHDRKRCSSDASGCVSNTCSIISVITFKTYGVDGIVGLLAPVYYLTMRYQYVTKISMVI